MFVNLRLTLEWEGDIYQTPFCASMINDRFTNETLLVFIFVSFHLIFANETNVNAQTRKFKAV